MRQIKLVYDPPRVETLILISEGVIADSLTLIVDNPLENNIEVEW